MTLKQLLRRLVETPGVSGNEEKIRELIRDEVEEHADEVEVDDFGNLIVRKGSGEKTLMLDAHMDQIGLTVRRIDDAGFIRVSKVGGIYPESLINQRVKIHTSEGEDLTGVIGTKPVHRKDEEEKKQLPDMHDLFVDIGAEDREDAESLGVNKGDFISYDRDFAELENGYVTGPAFDDRVGCAIAIKALERFDSELDYELAVVFSAQEEVGRKGAQTAAYGVDPDVALALDISMAGDVPAMDADDSTDETGKGIGIDMLQAGGRGLITPAKIRDWLLETGESGDHRYFRSLYDGGTTDASVINLVRGGIPSGSIGIPTRNIHTPVEVVKMSDLEAAVDFLEHAFETFPEHF
ncbi:MAG: M42 family metallopeptidase [Candidatus Nanohaloarchaea archaeon]